MSSPEVMEETHELVEETHEVMEEQKKKQPIYLMAWI